MADTPAAAPAATPAVDLNQYVPKADFEALQAERVESTKSLEQLKNQLLDRDYLDFLEARKAPAAPAAPVGSVDLKNLDMKGLVELIQKHTLDVVTRAVGPQLNAFRGALTDVQAVIEVGQVKQKYEDFEDYAKDIETILKSTQNELTIEQAYLMAKAQSPAPAPKEGAPAPKAPTRNERPSSVVPLDGETIKTFKTPQEAGTAAANEVLARHGLSGDSI